MGELEYTIVFKAAPFIKNGDSKYSFPSLGIFHTLVHGITCCPLHKILEGKIKLLLIDDFWTQTQMSFLDRSGEGKT